jgi:hypothetical protein
MPNIFPSSVLELGSLSEPTTPSLLDIRSLIHGLQGSDAWIHQQAYEEIQASIENLQQTLRSASPSLQHLEIDSADIVRLCVGGEFDPGQLLVLGGPPTYAPAGWVGTQLDGSPIALDNITAGTATTTAPHNLKADAAVLVDGTGGNDGYFVVDTIVSPTEFTVVGGFPVNTTGGEVARLFQGGWLAQFACGGSYFGDAPFQVDVDGQLSITDALIVLTSIAGTLTSRIQLDPSQATITASSYDSVLGGSKLLLDDGALFLNALDGSGATDLDGSFLSITRAGFFESITGLTSFGASRVLDVKGYTGSTPYGPLLSLHQLRGSPLSVSHTQNGDTLGGVIGKGSRDTGSTDYSAGIRMIATQNHTSTARGTKAVVEATPNGAAGVTWQFTFDQDGTLNVPLALKVGANQVVSTRKAKPTQTTRTAGAAYTANEQAMLNELKAWQDGVNNALSALAGGHGLWT